MDNRSLPKQTFPLILLISFLLSACTGYTPVPATPTAAPEPTAVPLPFPTYNLPEGVTPLDPDTVKLGRVQVVPDGMYAFRAPREFFVTVEGPLVNIANQNESFVTSLVMRETPGQAPIREILAEFVRAMSDDIDDFVASEPYPYYMGLVPGEATDIDGIVLGARVKGRAAVVQPAPGLAFYAFGFMQQGQEGYRWEQEGYVLFDTIIKTVTLMGPGARPCILSEDPTYGYAADNPIRVGGGVDNGPGREEAYFLNLLSPDGQSITVERVGSSETQGGPIVDAWEITYPGLDEPIMVFLDEYNYEEPMAPLGFLCVGPFPFALP